jgi:signal transduction histidine kinase
LWYDEEMETKIEPGLLGTFKLFAGLEAAMYLALVIYLRIFPMADDSNARYFYYLNMVGTIALFFYLEWSWLQKKLGSWYLTLALTVATLTPIITNRVFLNSMPAGNSAAPIINAWQWMPMLFVPLVLIAWQYNMLRVVLYSLATGYVDLSLILSFAEKFSLQLLPVLFVSIIRTVSFMVVGYIVIKLMTTQREQRKELLEANRRMSQHSMTVQQLAVSRERNRLARELHDTLAHTLSGLAIHLEATKTALNPNEKEAMEMLDHALSVTRNGLTETRRALKDLRATNLDDMGLSLSLRNLVESFEERTEIPVIYSIPPDLGAGSPETEQGIFRIAQEALENVARHSGANQVDFSVTQHDHTIKLKVSDNGKGFDTTITENSDDHFGVHGMFEWAESIGGKLSLDSSAGEGTSITLVLES